jgi:hypothetical protein
MDAWVFIIPDVCYLIPSFEGQPSVKHYGTIVCERSFSDPSDNKTVFLERTWRHSMCYKRRFDNVLQTDVVMHVPPRVFDDHKSIEAFRSARGYGGVLDYVKQIREEEQGCVFGTVYLPCWHAPLTIGFNDLKHQLYADKNIDTPSKPDFSSFMRVGIPLEDPYVQENKYMTETVRQHPNHTYE